MKGAYVAAIAITGLLLVVAFSFGFFAPSSTSALSNPTFYRPVYARIYAFNAWTLAGETPTTAGNAIASLNPSYVGGLLRIEYNLAPTNQMFQDFATVRGIVLAANPNTKFGVDMRTSFYPTVGSLSSAITSTIGSMSPKPDYMAFDSYDALTQCNPIPAPYTSVAGCVTDFQNTAVNTAHSLGVKVLGDVLPTVNVAKLYALPDAISTSDWPVVAPATTIASTWCTSGSACFIQGANMTKLVALGRPVILHVNNGANPIDANGNTERSLFVNSWTSAQRSAFVTQAAQAQASGNFAYMYNAFWPAGQSGQIGGTLPIYYDSIIDGTLPLMRTLAFANNAIPAGVMTTFCSTTTVSGTTTTTSCSTLR